ncbi:MAG: hypothetical protein ACK41C_02215 [Phenylobacterium sp.]|uniref:hypothetical protein n=1 Tax=Phenylobacterium sp. TaxID=1871053 RepID=UPI00391A0263
MAEPRQDAETGKDRLQSQGRDENAAQPLDAAADNAGAERYPPTRADDGLDRSFEPKVRNETAPAASPNEGRLGPAADPSEGKRDEG